jgi:hypothetical protein
MIVSSGRSQRHVGAVAEKVVESLKAQGARVRVEGLPACDWVLIDAGDLIVTSSGPRCAASTILRRCGERIGRPSRPSRCRTTMRLALVAIGRLKSGPETDLAARYRDRAVRWPVAWAAQVPRSSILPKAEAAMRMSAGRRRRPSSKRELRAVSRSFSTNARRPSRAKPSPNGSENGAMAANPGSAS